MNKNQLKKWAGTLTIIAVILLCVAFLNRALRRPDSDARFRPFIDGKQEYDVLFYGTSHVVNAVFPYQLWEDYGITSYNVATYASALATQPYFLRETIQFHKPKVAVLDLALSAQDSSYMDSFYQHKSFDAFPLDKYRIAEIENCEFDEDVKREMYFPLMLYHNRISEVTIQDVKTVFGIDGLTREKGATGIASIAPPADFDRIPQDQIRQETTVAIESVKDFVAICREEGIQPILIHIPYPVQAEEQEAVNTIGAWAAEENVPFIDMMYEDAGVDLTIDMHDTDSHLNVSGGKKVTDYLGKYLSTQLQVADYRQLAESDAAAAAIYSEWDEELKDYHLFLKEQIEAAENLDIALLMVYQGNYDAELMVDPDRFPQNEVDQKLMDQIGPDHLTIHRTGLEGETVAQLTVTDGRSGQQAALLTFDADHIHVQ